LISSNSTSPNPTSPLPSPPNDDDDPPDSHSPIETQHHDSTTEPIFSNWDEINPLGTLAEEVERAGILKSSSSRSSSPHPSKVSSDTTSVNASSSVPSGEVQAGGKKSPPNLESANAKWARCKHCGQRVERTVEAIEAHSEQCHETIVAQKRALSADGAVGGEVDFEEEYRGAMSGKEEEGKLGGVTKDPAVEVESRQVGVTRIIYRTSHSPSQNLFSPREHCCLQDSFVDEEGIAYVYEISVLHKKVFGCKGHTTAEVLFLAHIARPDPQDSNKSILSVISQVDNKMGGLPDWLGNIMPDSSKYSSIAFEGLARELEEAKRQHAKLLKLEDEEDMAAETTEGDASIDDFELLAVLGRGGFGKVMMVRHKKDANVYAMKVLKKAELLRRRQVERTRTERHILEKATGHPFMVSLAYAFQTKHKLYMVMDFVQGGDFFTFLRKVGRMKESWAQLYVCEIALALQALHDIDVVYRDLKPENVLMERDGHVKLTDFGLSRSFEMRDALPDDMEKGRGAMGYTTRSFCGTEQYMSPEMLLQRGHTKAVDWWCLGLLMHEMLTGRHPFHGGTHYDTLKNMVSRPPTLDGRLSDGAKSILMGFLTKDSTKRYGCSPLGAKELQVHRFFSGLNWNKVMRKEIPAPYIPQVGNVADTSNFEDVFTKERPVDSVVASTSTAEQRGWLGGFFSAITIGGGKGNNSDPTKTKKKKKRPTGGDPKKRVESLSEFNNFSFKADKERIEKIGKNAEGGGEKPNSGEGGSATPPRSSTPVPTRK